MTWRWRLEDSDGAEIAGESLGVVVVASDNQGDAESWLGEHWRELLGKGVTAVTLFENDRRAYGPMALSPR